MPFITNDDGSCFICHATKPFPGYCDYPVCIDCQEEHGSAGGRCRDCNLEYLFKQMTCVDCGKLKLNELGIAFYGPDAQCLCGDKTIA